MVLTITIWIKKIEAIFHILMIRFNFISPFRFISPTLFRRFCSFPCQPSLRGTASNIPPFKINSRRVREGKRTAIWRNSCPGDWCLAVTSGPIEGIWNPLVYHSTIVLRGHQFLLTPWWRETPVSQTALFAVSCLCTQQKKNFIPFNLKGKRT